MNILQKKYAFTEILKYWTHVFFHFSWPEIIKSYIVLMNFMIYMALLPFWLISIFYIFCSSYLSIQHISRTGSHQSSSLTGSNCCIRWQIEIFIDISLSMLHSLTNKSRLLIFFHPHLMLFPQFLFSLRLCRSLILVWFFFSCHAHWHFSWYFICALIIFFPLIKREEGEHF